MRTRVITMLALLLAGGLLSGCVIEPLGYRHHHHYDRY